MPLESNYAIAKVLVLVGFIKVSKKRWVIIIPIRNKPGACCGLTSKSSWPLSQVWWCFWSPHRPIAQMAAKKKYSTVFVLIRPPSLVSADKIQNKCSFKTRLVGLISTKKRIIYWSSFMESVHGFVKTSKVLHEFPRFIIGWKCC